MDFFNHDKWYEPNEICEMLHVKNGPNYARDVKSRLDRAGFQYLYKTKRVKFLSEPRDIDRRLKFLLELKGIRVEEVKEFAIFYYCLINSKDYQYCPWKYRAKLLNEEYGCNVDDKKLARWAKMLIDAGMLVKTSPDDKEVWITYWWDGEPYQEQVDMEDEDAVQMKNKYWDFFWSQVEYYKKNPKETKRKPARQASIDCRKKFGCCYYSCRNFVACAWASDYEEQIIKDTIRSYVEEVYPS